MDPSIRHPLELSGLDVVDVLKDAGFHEKRIDLSNIQRALAAATKLLHQVRTTNHAGALLQPALAMLESVYRSPTPVNGGHAGVVIKQLIAELYCISDGKSVAVRRTDNVSELESELLTLIFKINLVQQIWAFDRMRVSSPRIFVVPDGIGLRAGDEKSRLAYTNQLHAAVALGRALRTLKESRKAMTGAVTFLRAIQAVCSGAEPDRISSFAGTVLAKIAGVKDPDARLFWTRLLSLANMVIVATCTAQEQGVKLDAPCQMSPYRQLLPVHGDWIMSDAIELT